MSCQIKITYVNHSINLDRPPVFIFTKNEVPTFEALKHGIAWRVLPDLGRGSFSTFLLPDPSQACRTAPESELLDQDNGLPAAEAGKPAPASRMYWALAADGQEDGAAVPDPKSLFELNLEGVTEVTVGLYGSPQEGYHFKVDSIK